MYCCIASSCDVPLRLFQASHLARPTMSREAGLLVGVVADAALLVQRVDLEQRGVVGALAQVLRVRRQQLRIAFSGRPWVCSIVGCRWVRQSTGLQARLADGDAGILRPGFADTIDVRSANRCLFGPAHDPGDQGDTNAWLPESARAGDATWRQRRGAGRAASAQERRQAVRRTRVTTWAVRSAARWACAASA